MTRMTCVYDGKEFSEGSEVCQEGRVKECRGEKWIDTGRECAKIRSPSNDDVAADDVLEPPSLYAPDDQEDDLLPDSFEVDTNTLGCASLVAPPPQIKNTCGGKSPKFVRATVEFRRDNQVVYTSEFRLPSQFSRPFRWRAGAHGASIVNEVDQDVDTTLGTQALRFLSHYKDNRNVWYVRNNGIRYVYFVYVVNFADETKWHVHGVLSPGSRSRVHVDDGLGPPVINQYIRVAAFETD